jgi:hypothetical protein
MRAASSDLGFHLRYRLFSRPVLAVGASIGASVAGAAHGAERFSGEPFGELLQTRPCLRGAGYSGAGAHETPAANEANCADASPP